MNDLTQTPPGTEPPPASRGARLARKAGAVSAILAVLLVVFYLEENWRGNAAWEKEKQKLEAQQEKLNWDAYVPPPVADDQNFFKAPKMQEWFVGRGTNELVTRLSRDSFAARVAAQAASNVIATVAELILRPPGAASDAASAPIVPLLTVDESSVSDGIRRLADRAKVKLTTDPKLNLPLKHFSGQWTNVSALSVLLSILSANNLRWTDDPSGNAVITGGETNMIDSPGREIVLGLVRAGIGRVSEVPDGFLLAAAPMGQEGPRRVSVAPDGIPTLRELSRLYPGTNEVSIEPAGNSLLVRVNHAPLTAADYLAWSDQFAPEFNQIREAAKRPQARPDGDYSQLNRVPVPNFIAIRAAAFALAGRAKASLMRNQSEEALSDLTLLNQLRQAFDFRPKTIAAAETDDALATVIAETVSAGVRWQVWHEPDLAALETDLGGVDTVTGIWTALESERAATCHMLDTGSRDEIASSFFAHWDETSFLQRARNPFGLALRLSPAGWLRQNMVHVAEWDQKLIDAADRLQTVIRPHAVEDAGNAITADEVGHHHSLTYFLAKGSYYAKGASLKSAAQAQAIVNETVVACALERCRLARGKFPATLPELAPQYLTLVPTDPVTGDALHYRLLSPARFLLYSVGWDAKDDNGVPVNADGNGDWVWEH